MASKTFDPAVVESARVLFDRRVASPDAALHGNLQAQLAAWQARNFGATPPWQLALGAAEEIGELCHAILKGEQGIRGFEDREAMIGHAADAIADATIYLINLSTVLRLDFEALLAATAERVLRRDWIRDRADGRSTEEA